MAALVGAAAAWVRASAPGPGSAVDRLFAAYLAGVLDVPVPVARRLAEEGRAGLTPGAYHVRAGAFLIATTLPGRAILPRAARERAIHSLVGRMLARPFPNLLYVGVQRDPAAAPAVGLVQT